MKKKRLDVVLKERGLIAEDDDPFVVVTEGRVFVDGQKAISPAQMVSSDARLEVRGGDRYVGRGALKLEAALQEFGIDVSGKTCADIGAATGGFTEVLLRHGAARVYAIDTARGKLALKLRRDPRVVVMEQTDIRRIESLSEQADIVTIDVSLISLRQILPAAKRFLQQDGIVVALFKPQYETRDPSELRHGIVVSDEVRGALLNDFMQWAKDNEWEIKNHMESPIRGSEGNAEYLLRLKLKIKEQNAK